MFELHICDPATSVVEVILRMESQDAARARDFLARRGIYRGWLVNAEDPRDRILVYGFRDQPSMAAKELGNFGYIPNGQAYFVFRHLLGLGVKIRSFLDLGCGAGNILMNARHLLGAERLTGVEIDPALAAQARENTDSFNAEIIEADITRWRPEQNDFDLVFFYNPFQTQELNRSFFTHLKGWLRKGQLICCPKAVHVPPHWLELVDIKGYPHPFMYQASV